MKPESFSRLMLPVFLIFFFSTCRSDNSFLLSLSYKLSDPGVPWENALKIKKNNFIIYAEPGIKESEINLAHTKLAEQQKDLSQAFFTGWSQKEIRVVLYRDIVSYSKFKPTPLNSGAHYISSTRTMHIPVSSPTYIWRHELMHALLEIMRPGTPYWLHEGLAYFIQLQHFGGTVSCVNPLYTSVPYDFHVFIEELRYREDLRPSSYFDARAGEEAGLNAVLSTYFIFFLWDKHLLSGSLSNYLYHDKISMEYILTGGNSASWEALAEEFRIWLKSDHPLKKIKGC
jgi:hypothetical protein